MPLLDTLTDALAAAGLNLLGVADPAAWDVFAPPSRRAEALLPGTRAIVVIGSGGPDLWRAFVADLRAHPEHLTEEAHPLDAFVHRAVAAAETRLAHVSHRWFYASALTDFHLDFRVLGELAGLGSRSRLGLLLNARHGPWLGLRAACFVAEDVPFSPPAPDLCHGCVAPCVAACPGGAFPVDATHGPRWSVDACTAFRDVSPACGATCHARVACPVGAGERYDEAAVRYHYDREAGRRWLREELGIVAGDRPGDDHWDGVGPHWIDWRARVDVSGGSRGA